jgi:hypothetical protein
MTTAEDFLAPFEGALDSYRRAVRSGDQRLGQAFFNALPPDARALLVGTLADPFYSSDPGAVQAAIAFLEGRGY